MEQYDFSILMPYLDLLAALKCDLDGTSIINNEDEAHKAISRTIFEAALQEFQKHGIQLCKFDVDSTHPLAGTPLPDIISHYSEKLGVELPTNEIVHQIKEHRKTMPLENEHVYVLPVFKQLLLFLKSNYVPRVIVTSSEFDRAERYVIRGDLHVCFDDYKKYIFTGHKPKPDPYLNAWIYLMEVHRTFLPKENCAGLEDTPSGIKSCKAAGMVAIGHTMATHVTDKVKLAGKLAKAGADYIINDPEEVIPVLVQAISNMPVIESQLQRRSRIVDVPVAGQQLHLRLV